jgi:hypothetical protein
VIPFIPSYAPKGYQEYESLCFFVSCVFTNTFYARTHAHTHAFVVHVLFVGFYDFFFSFGLLLFLFCFGFFFWTIFSKKKNTPGMTKSRMIKLSRRKRRISWQWRNTCAKLN